MSRAEKKTIVLIDDSPSDRRIFRRFLEHKNDGVFEIVEAASAKAGVETCRQNKPHCIVLDFKLPDGDGLSLIAEIQKVTKAPIIFVTGQPVALAQTQAYRYGVVKFISKDLISSEVLRAAVTEALASAEK